MKKSVMISIFIVFSIVFAACSDDGSSKEESSDNDQGKNNQLNVSLAAEPVSLDPHAANDGNSLYVMNPMYDTLWEQNTELELQPALAKSLEQIEDIVWEAKLREDVLFHDGSAFNAEVVKANLDRVLDPEIGSPLAFLFDMIEEVEVVDEYTVHIKTEYPFSALPSHLAHPGGHMISLESIKEDNEAIENGEQPFTTINEQPVGTGYFQFDERSIDGEITLTKNDNYWGEEAGVEAISFRSVPEDQTRVAEIQTGNSDIIYPVNANNVEEIDSNKGTYVKQSESASMTYVGFNVEREPFTDERVRQAIAMSINKDEIVNGAMNGIPIPAKGPLAPTVFGHSDELLPIEQNVEEAKELLGEAGYEEGFETTVMAYDTTTSDIATVIQSNLQQIGIDVEIQMTEIGNYLETTGNGGADMFVGSWGTVTLDADYGLYPMFHSENIGDPGNRSFYANEEVDGLLEEARQEGNKERRLELYQEAQQIIIDEAPIVPLYHSVLLAGLRDEVQGFYQFPSSFPYLRDVTKKE
ncbi:ABC transporter substrate-binding protein [Oceanobacillus sp. E9]|uniref:glutathione ABC transporter substrate-binding protein n=1 Tax=Oceanobacillus TaxID=182709 RepID=UPI00084E4C2E|nr:MULTISPECIES: glutathione ABC transporter substrate-binding protein [Oceanobacillus]OEH54918.1 ABC transporter substrate-binding protein [Oceanobacillus sp. E9]